ncbi:conserved unknown protein [Ectocarpus siliculosus]|uniref:Uncharacterized protein n=1 Tax=Ectocarpus siliculosus TaxID=2880 RepID=D7FHL8_ECTSI|nr:conserved unknown protein [Ectocarpus siliculosus]|eukprot:CBJ28575.1 conserved unknown protein [Ectocarpus siliculosus]
MTLKMVAAKKSAGAVVVLLAASCSKAVSFMAPPPSTTSAAAASKTFNRCRAADACRRCSLDVTPTTSDANERWQRQERQWQGGSRGQRRGRRSSELWWGKVGKLASSKPSEDFAGEGRADGGSTTAGVAQGREALGGGGSAASMNQRQGAPASEEVLGADSPVTSAAVAEAGRGKDKDSLEWSEVGTECQKRVYICTNRWCMEKGSAATLGSFVGLAPEGEVLVQGVNCLGRCNKGPNVRVRQETGNWLEFNRIENVERVYKILRDYLGADVSKEAALCLKYNFLANAALNRNEVTLAIDYYDKAIDTGYADQQGVLLVRTSCGREGSWCGTVVDDEVMRATAFIQRAYSHGRALTELLQKVVVDRPTQTTLDVLHELWEASGASARMVLLGKFAQDCEGRGSLYQKTKFRYGLYEFALLRVGEISRHG